MSEKLFIVTEEEVANYVSTQQSRLLDTFEALAGENPDVPLSDLLAYTRENYVLGGAEATSRATIGDASTGADTDANELDTPPALGDETVAEETFTPASAYDDGLDDDTDDEVSTEGISFFNPEEAVEDVAVANEVVDEPVAVAAGDAETFEAPVEFEGETDDADDDTDEAGDEPQAEEHNIAFRNKNRFKGLFREASKVDEGK